jgi:alkylation response protein AidB-like acyl-CoA dehydrogenase
MDLTFSEKEEQFRLRLRDWLEQNLPEGWLEGKTGLPEDSKERELFLRDWQRKLYEGGWAGLSWPKEYGGQGATLIEQVIYEQELVRVNAPPMLNVIGISTVGPTLISIGTEYQRKRYIPKLLNGEEIWCQGYSEPNAGSDLAALQTSAIKEGDQWIINGQKIWTSQAHLADKCFLLARTQRTGRKHQGITAFIVDMKQKGIETRSIHQINEKQDFSEAFFNDVIAYDEDIVGELNDGWKVGLTLLSHERFGAARQIFLLQGIFKNLIQDIKRLEKNGHSIATDPVIRMQLFNLYTKVKTALLNYYRNITNQMKRGYPGPYGSMDKLNSSELLKELYGFVLSLHGPASTLYKEDALIRTSVQEGYLSALSRTIAGGTSSIQRNIIAERILGLPKDIKK